MRFADTPVRFGLLAALCASLVGCGSVTQPLQALKQVIAPPAPSASAPAAPNTAAAVAAPAKAEPETPVNAAAQRTFDDARRALRAGRTDEAERGFRALAKSNPELGGPRANLGLIYRQAGKYPEAVAEFEQAVRASPRQPIYLNQLGIAYRQEGQFAKARDAYERAIALDPNYAHAHAWKACVIGQAWLNNWVEDIDASVREISEEIQTALALDDNDADVHRILAALKLTFHEYDKAVYHQERALSLNANSDLIVVQQGEMLTWLGRPTEGIEWIQRAMRLNPYHPQRFWSHLGRAQYTARLYADAIQSFSKLTTPDHTHHAFLAASSAQLGNNTAARAHAQEVLQREPGFTAEGFLGTLHYQQRSDREHLRDGLVKAGLPG